MATLNKPENFKTIEAHDLGQISTKARYIADDKNDGEFAGWYVDVVNKDRGAVTIWEKSSVRYSDYINWGYQFAERYGPLEINTWNLTKALADICSKNKDDREYGRHKVKQWAEIGKAVYRAARHAIDEAKAEQHHVQLNRS